MIKIKQNHLILFAMVLLVIGLLVGVIAVQSTQNPSSKAAEYQYGVISGQPALPNNAGGSCYDRCRAGGGNPIVCWFGCLNN